MSTVPKLELTVRQEPAPEHFYFHMLPVEPNELLSCEDCGEGRQMAELKVSQNPPFRHRAPLCAKHADMAKAEWVLHL